jgi:ABC-2 type transport system permease protein/sodium transport system permease protein
MSRPQRISRLFIKDLLDILRDRRTLITLIVVPIVLYPGLMLCFIQLGSIQADEMKTQQVIIGVEDEAFGQWLQTVLQNAKVRHDGLGKREESAVSAIPDWRVVWITKLSLDAWLQQSLGHCAVRQAADGPTWHEAMRDDRITLQLEILSDTAEIRSAMAADRMARLLHDHGRIWLRERFEVPAAHLEPVTIERLDVATAVKRGGSMLGQILPLVLVLMTITGAIYPAIDLTAGERERGTLETLIVCPVPMVEIMTGKFLVVVTVSLLGATLNLVSMGLTIHLGGITQALAMGAETEIPVGMLPFILLCLVPLSILFSAILLAVSSFARSFKEAQSYVTPVIMGVLMPAGIAALPGTELEGFTTVVPVANMVLLTREMLLGSVAPTTLFVIMLSTGLYAAAAVAIAARVFGQEAVLFADAGSWRAQLSRRLIRPSLHPKPTLALLTVAVLFPVWFYVQNALQMYSSGGFADGLVWMQAMMVVLFLVIPVALVAYNKVDLCNAFGLHWPTGASVLGAVLLGSCTWILGHELIQLQQAGGLFGLSEEWIEAVAPLESGLATIPVAKVLILMAVIPAICEEVLFRGLLLSGLRRILRKWSVIVTVAVIFAMYHYLIQRLLLTFALGAVLAWVCWQSRSIVPAVILHLMHNGITLLLALPDSRATACDWLRIPVGDEGSIGHLPVHLLIAAGILAITGVALFCRAARRGSADLGDEFERRRSPAQ